MNTATVFFVGAVVGVLVTASGVLGLLKWMVSGEPDVNGDPERDAGLTAREGICRQCGREYLYCIPDEPAEGLCLGCFVNNEYRKMEEERVHSNH